MLPVAGSDAPALIDDDAPARVWELSWFLLEGRPCAEALSATGRRVLVTLRRLVTDARPGQLVRLRRLDRPLDLRRANLVVGTKADCIRAARKRRRATSRYRGVYRDPATRRWRAQVWQDGRNHHAGRFDTEQEAARARDDLAARLLGQAAVLNFPNEDVPA
jgi:hypothetical protein